MVNVGEYSSKEVSYFCHSTQKSIWAISTQQKGNCRGQIVKEIKRIFNNCNKLDIAIDAQTLYKEISLRMKECEFGTFQGCPIQFGIPLLPFNGNNTKYYFTYSQIVQGESIKKQQSERRERYKEIHFSKGTCFGDLQNKILEDKNKNIVNFEHGWRIIDENISQFDLGKIPSIFQDPCMINKTTIVSIRGEKGTGKTTLSKKIYSFSVFKEKYIELVFCLNLDDQIFNCLDQMYDFLFDSFLKKSLYFEEDRIGIKNMLKDKDRLGKILWIVDQNEISSCMKKFLLTNLKKLILITTQQISENVNTHLTLFGFGDNIKAEIKEKYPQHSIFVNHQTFFEVFSIPLFTRIMVDNHKKTSSQILQDVTNSILNRLSFDKEKTINLIGKISFFQLKQNSSSIPSFQIEKYLYEVEFDHKDHPRVLHDLEYQGILNKIPPHQYKFSHSLIRDLFLADLFARVVNRGEITPDKYSKKIMKAYSDICNLITFENSVLIPLLCSLIKDEQKVGDILLNCDQKKDFFKEDTIALSLHFSSLDISKKYISTMSKKSESSYKIFKAACSKAINVDVIDMFMKKGFDLQFPLCMALENSNKETAKRLIDNLEKTTELLILTTSYDFAMIDFFQEIPIEFNKTFFENLTKTGTIEHLKRFHDKIKCESLLNEILHSAIKFERIEMIEFLFDSEKIDKNAALLHSINVERPNAKIVRFFIERGSTNLNEMFVSCFDKDVINLEIPSILIEYTVDVNYRNKNQRCALDYACSGANRTTEPIEFLIKNGAKDSYSSFSYAFKDNVVSESVSKYIINQGWTPRRTTDNNSIDYAYEDPVEKLVNTCKSQNNNKEIIRDLINQLGFEQKCDALFRLCGDTNIPPEKIKIFLKDSDLRNATNKDGHDLSYVSCAAGNIKTFKLLLKKGFNSIQSILEGLNDCNNQSKVEKIINFLMKNQIKQDKEIKTSHFAVQNFDHYREQILKDYLIDSFGCELNRIFKTVPLSLSSLPQLKKFNYDNPDKKGKNPLFYYCANPLINFKVFKQILEKPHSNTKDKKQRNILHILYSNPSTSMDIIEIVKDKFNNWMEKDEDGHYPIYYAIKNIRPDIYYSEKHSSMKEESFEKAMQDPETRLCWSCETLIKKDITSDIHKFKSSVFYAFKNATTEDHSVLMDKKQLTHKQEALEGALIGGHVDIVRKLIDLDVGYEGRNPSLAIKFQYIKENYKYEKDSFASLFDSLSQRRYLVKSDFIKQPPVILNLCKDDPFSKSAVKLFKNLGYQRAFSTREHEKVEQIVENEILKDFRVQYINYKDTSSLTKLSMAVFNCRLRYNNKKIEMSIDENWAELSVIYSRLVEYDTKAVVLNVFGEVYGHIENLSYMRKLPLNTIINQMSNHQERINGFFFFANIINHYLFEELTLEESYIKCFSPNNTTKFLKVVEERLPQIAIPPIKYDRTFLILNLSRNTISSSEVSKLSNAIPLCNVINNLDLIEEYVGVWIVVIFFDKKNTSNSFTFDEGRGIRKPTRVIRTKEDDKKEPKNTNNNSNRNYQPYEGPIKSFDDIKNKLKKVVPTAVFAFAIDDENTGCDTNVFRNESFLDYCDILFYNKIYKKHQKHFQLLGQMFNLIKTSGFSFEQSFKKYMTWKVNRSKKTKSTMIKYEYIQKPIELFESSIDHLSFNGFKQKNRLINNNPFVRSVIDGDRETIKMLLQSQCKGINGNDHSGRTPLIISVLKDDFHSSVMLLTSKEVDVNAIDPMSGNTALHICCAKYQGKYSLKINFEQKILKIINIIIIVLDIICNIILEKKPLLGILNFGLSSALHFAFKYGTITTDQKEKTSAQQICTSLIQKGANPDKDYYGEVTQTLYGEGWEKREPLFIDWYRRVMTQQPNEFTPSLVFLEEKSFVKQIEPEQLQIQSRIHHTKRVLIINCNPKTRIGDIGNIKLFDLIIKKQKEIFIHIKIENVDVVTTIEELIEKKNNHYWMVVFFGFYKEESFIFLNNQGEPTEYLPKEDFFSLLSNSRNVFLNLENPTKKEITDLLVGNTYFDFLISNFRNVSANECFFFNKYFLSSIFFHNDNIEHALHRAHRFVIQQQDVFSSPVQAYSYSSKYENLKN